MCHFLKVISFLTVLSSIENNIETAVKPTQRNNILIFNLEVAWPVRATVALFPWCGKRLKKINTCVFYSVNISSLIYSPKWTSPTVHAEGISFPKTTNVKNSVLHEGLFSKAFWKKKQVDISVKHRFLKPWL